MAEFNYQNRRDFLKYFIGTSAFLAGFPALSNEVLKRISIPNLMMPALHYLLMGRNYTRFIATIIMKVIFINVY